MHHALLHSSLSSLVRSHHLRISFFVSLLVCRASCPSVRGKPANMHRRCGAPHAAPTTNEAWGEPPSSSSDEKSDTDPPVTRFVAPSFSPPQGISELAAARCRPPAPRLLSSAAAASQPTAYDVDEWSVVRSHMHAGASYSNRRRRPSA